MKIIHLNATPNGGGVAEILKSLVPLEQSLGLNSSWFALNDDKRLFAITKKLHNSLQGSNDVLTLAEQKYYLAYNKQLSEHLLRVKPDILVVHDPQPLAVGKFLPASVKLISRMHIDMSRPNRKSLALIKPLFDNFHKVIFSLPEYAPRFLGRKIFISPPAIDPLALKNIWMNLAQARKICESLGVDVKRSIMVQVSRFDFWKDPIGVIQSYNLVKSKFPKVQLILSGMIEAQDDPEAKAVLANVKKYAANDPDIFIFHDKSQIGRISIDVFVSALQTCASVVFQKSIKEGFGLTVTEAMWKRKPVIGGAVGGIKFQIMHGKNGWLVKNPKEAANVAIEILSNPQLASRVGKAARKTVLRKFLLTRFLQDEFAIMESVL